MKDPDRFSWLETVLLFFVWANFAIAMYALTGFLYSSLGLHRP